MNKTIKTYKDELHDTRLPFSYRNSIHLSSNDETKLINLNDKDQDWFRVINYIDTKL